MRSTFDMVDDINARTGSPSMDFRTHGTRIDCRLVPSGVNNVRLLDEDGLTLTTCLQNGRRQCKGSRVLKVFRRVVSKETAFHSPYMWSARSSLSWGFATPAPQTAPQRVFLGMRQLATSLVSYKIMLFISCELYERHIT